MASEIGKATQQHLTVFALLDHRIGERCNERHAGTDEDIDRLEMLLDNASQEVPGFCFQYPAAAIRIGLRSSPCLSLPLAPRGGPRRVKLQFLATFNNIGSDTIDVTMVFMSRVGPT